MVDLNRHLVAGLRVDRLARNEVAADQADRAEDHRAANGSGGGSARLAANDRPFIFKAYWNFGAGRRADRVHLKSYARIDSVSGALVDLDDGAVFRRPGGDDRLTVHLHRL